VPQRRIGANVGTDDFDYVVVPRGRAAELLVTHERAVALVMEFANKGKVVASVADPFDITYFRRRLSFTRY